MAVAALLRKLPWPPSRRNSASSAHSQDHGPFTDRVPEGQKVPDCPDPSSLVTVRCGKTYILRRVGDSSSRASSRAQSKERVSRTPSKEKVRVPSRATSFDCSSEEGLDASVDEVGNTVGDNSTTAAAADVAEKDINDVVPPSVASLPSGFMGEFTDQSLDDIVIVPDTTIEPVARVIQNMRGTGQTTARGTASSIRLCPVGTCDAESISCGFSCSGDAWYADTRHRVMSVMPGSLLLCTESTACTDDDDADASTNCPTDWRGGSEEMQKPCTSSL
eukprot:TRINITY_DN103663_c0_g1_i1.p1 TRINITY_DN103663_c0_g1~~TRINITY_DN103663_c0_g1_i1.p1  ORF type:complete len:276 (+),score=19.95 TRINITY_DN103663_c0_g1_i1:80-907(+)